MADVILVIKIPEHYYDNIKKDLPIYLTEDNILKILPKDYGRISISYDDGNYIREIYTRENP